MSGKVLICCLILAYLYSPTSAESPTRGRVESCPGCSLNRLHEVKKFIFEDIPKYEDVEFKKISGAPPELVILNDADNEIERISLKSYNREELNHLMIEKGFKLKDVATSKENKEL